MMEKSVGAFFYNYKYYLLPRDMTVREIKDNTAVIYVKRLKEEKCMAPDFVYESIADEELFIDNTDRLFAVNVNLYSCDEYDEILRKQVELRCKNCVSYIEDDNPSLEGHHREIALDGSCFLRLQKGETWTFALCVDCFWELLAEKLGEIAACIDEGDMAKMNGIIGKEMDRFMPPVEFYGDKAGGRYNLYMQGGKAASPFMNVVYGYIADAALQENSPIAKAGWRVYDFTPAGVATYHGKTEIKDTDKLFYTVPSSVGFRFGVFMEHYKAEELSEEETDAILSDIDRYLSAELGDDVVGSVVDGYEIVWDDENTITMSEVKDKIRQMYAALKQECNGNVPHPMPIFYGADKEPTGDWWLPYRNYIREGSTTCPNATFVDRAELEKKPWWLNYFTFAYLYVPRPTDGMENAAETLMWYLQHAALVPEPLRDPKDTVLYGERIGFADCREHGFILDILVMDEKRFLRALRTLAPVLSSYDAKVVLVNKDGVNTYACGYDFTPVDFDF
jgi:hypothetical protein